MDFLLKFKNGERMPAGIMYCIGKNYAKHAKEMGGEVPKEPLVFLKPPTAYVESGGSVEYPPFSNNLHHEVELVVVIGKECRKVKKENAKEYIAGYGVGIDVTMRDVQQKAKDKGHPWAVAKGFAGSAPVSEIIDAGMFNEADPVFNLQLAVNGEIKQEGSTGAMERPVSLLIEYLSSVFILRPGDLIFTGTPEGVGPVQKGDKLTASLSGLTTVEVKII